MKKRAIEGNVPVDTTQWSDLSRRKLGYLSAPASYTDQAYRCRACGAEAVFTAAQQKHDYETAKAHTLRHRIHCEPCHQTLRGLLAENATLIRRWDDEKADLSQDVPALRHWLIVLEQLRKYSVRPDIARIASLKKLVGAE